MGNPQLQISNYQVAKLRIYRNLSSKHFGGKKTGLRHILRDVCEILHLLVHIAIFAMLCDIQLPTLHLVRLQLWPNFGGEPTAFFQSQPKFCSLGWASRFKLTMGFVQGGGCLPLPPTTKSKKILSFRYALMHSNLTLAKEAGKIFNHTQSPCHQSYPPFRVLKASHALTQSQNSSSRPVTPGHAQSHRGGGLKNIAILENIADIARELRYLAKKYRNPPNARSITSLVPKTIY